MESPARSVLVTGAAGNLGLAVAQAFGERGDNLVLVGHRREELAATFGNETHGRMFATADLLDQSRVDGVVRLAIDRFGRIDVLCNIAGGFRMGTPVHATSDDDWNFMFDVNVRTLLNCVRAVVPHMIEAGGGKIVNIASDAGRVGSSGESVYSACKGGIIAFSKTLARETARNNVRVNVVCPGPTDTALLQSFTGGGEFGQKVYDGLKRAIPLKRLGEPEDIPGAVAFLSSDDANFITGQIISVSGGLTMHG